MSAVKIYRYLLKSPEFYLRKLDLEKSTALFVPTTIQERRRGDFLDRPLEARGPTYRIGLRDLDAMHRALSPRPRSVYYIFHHAYCGSTLLAKCLARLRSCQLVMEPEVLAQLWHFKTHHVSLDSRGRSKDLDRLVELVTALLSRVDAGAKRTLVKLGDASMGILPDLLRLRPDSKALFLYSPLRRYIGQILKERWRKTHFVYGRIEWMRRQTADGPQELYSLDPSRLRVPQAAALLWMMQTHYYMALLKQVRKGRIKTLSSRDWFEMPLDSLKAAAEWMGMPVRKKSVERVLRSRVFMDYSKERGRAAGSRYGAARRRTDDREVADRHAADVEEGLQWAAPFLARYPVPNT